MLATLRGSYLINLTNDSNYNASIGIATSVVSVPVVLESR
jgi:hypothetical protein